MCLFIHLFIFTCVILVLNTYESYEILEDVLVDGVWDSIVELKSIIFVSISQPVKLDPLIKVSETASLTFVLYDKTKFSAS